MERLLKSVKKLDIYGHKVGVNYKGDPVFKTWPGAFSTIAVNLLVLYNLILLGQAFHSNSRQDERIT